MKEELQKEISEIQDQAANMLLNIRAVRGEEYEQLVRVLINLKNMIMFFGITLRHSTIKVSAQDKLDHHFMVAFENILMLMKELTGIDAKDLTDVLVDAKNIDDATNRLLRYAIFKD